MRDALSRLYKYAKSVSKLKLVVIGLLIIGILILAIMTVRIWLPLVIVVGFVTWYAYDEYKEKEQQEKLIKDKFDYDVKQKNINTFANLLFIAVTKTSDRFPMISPPADFNEVFNNASQIDNSQFLVFTAELVKRIGFISAPDTTEILRKQLQIRIDNLRLDKNLVVTDIWDMGTSYQLRLVYADDKAKQDYVNQYLRSHDKGFSGTASSKDEDF